jgi:Flp pilus assembly protein TadG
MRASEHGGAMVEFAFLLPLLLVTVIGLVDFGRAGYEAMEIENAAHAGAFYGSRSKELAADKVGIKAAALADMGTEVDTKSVTVESERYCECPNGASAKCDAVDPCAGILASMYVRVRVDKPFLTIFTYPGVPHEIDLEREVHLRVR